MTGLRNYAAYTQWNTRTNHATRQYCADQIRRRDSE